MAEKFIKTTVLDRSQIEEIKERISIEDVISRYVRLKPSGKNLFGLCPFHKEDTPSFSVNPELQIYKCFGCGEGGDVFSFLEKIENMEFPEVLEKLAQEAGIQLKYSNQDPKRTQQYLLVKNINDITANFYHKILTSHKLGEPGRKYLKIRKINEISTKEFKIGYAPRSSTNNALTNFLNNKGYDNKSLIEAGVAIERNGTVVDKFYDRLVFPIIDQSGKVVGFSGRVIRKDDERPKYLNSPETPIFQKRKNLFGYYQAKQEIRKKKYSILVEGQTDVISSWQAGIKNIVAPLGTGVTEEQLDKLAKITPNLILAFDSDNAGLRAIMRTSVIALNKSMNVFASQILFGKDADECIKKDPKLWIKSIQNRIPVVSFFLDLITQKYSPQSLAGKKTIIEKIGPLISSIHDQVTQEHHIKEISEITGIGFDLLKETFSRDITDNKYDIKTDNFEKEEVSTETYLLSLILQYHKELHDKLLKLDLKMIKNPIIKGIIFEIKENVDRKKSIDIHKLALKMDINKNNVLRDSLMRPIWTNDPSNPEIISEFDATIKKIKVNYIKSEIAALKSKLTISESRGSNKNTNEILNKISKKIAELDDITHF